MIAGLFQFVTWLSESFGYYDEGPYEFVTNCYYEYTCTYCAISTQECCDGWVPTYTSYTNWYPRYGFILTMIILLIIVLPAPIFFNMFLIEGIMKKTDKTCCSSRCVKATFICMTVFT